MRGRPGFSSRDLKEPDVVQLVPARYVTIGLASQLTGYTKKAIYAKVHNAVWFENKHWRRAPDGRILIDMRGYELWIEGR